MSDFLNKKLQQRIEAGNLRVLPKPSSLIDFCSNDYLGLSRSGELQNIIETAYHKILQNNKTGATGSRLISGNSVYYEDLETYLAQIFNAETTLLFNSGYTANMGVLSSIPQKGDTIIYDELSHSSIKDGIRLSFAERFAFRHNNADDLEKKISNAKGNIFVVVESVYSMDGDTAPLNEISEICDKYSAYLIIDEAHSTGILGMGGSGLVSELGLDKKVFIKVHTFGKAMGSHGACVAASSLVKNFLINFSRPFIYTTAMPLHNLTAIRCGFEYLTENPGLQSAIHQKINLYKKLTAQLNNKISSQSAIQALVIKGNKEAKKLASIIRESGFDVKAILAPTVKEGSERIRICLHAYDKDEDITSLCRILRSAAVI